MKSGNFRRGNKSEISGVFRVHPTKSNEGLRIIVERLNERIEESLKERKSSENATRSKRFLSVSADCGPFDPRILFTAESRTRRGREDGGSGRDNESAARTRVSSDTDERNDAHPSRWALSRCDVFVDGDKRTVRNYADRQATNRLVGITSRNNYPAFITAEGYTTPTTSLSLSLAPWTRYQDIAKHRPGGPAIHGNRRRAS